jgi:hypothetical protein
LADNFLSEGSWMLSTFENLEDAIKLASIDCELALKDIYPNLNIANVTINSYIKAILSLGKE